MNGPAETYGMSHCNRSLGMLGNKQEEINEEFEE